MLTFRLRAIARIVYVSILSANAEETRFIVLWMPVFQATGIITYFMLDREPSLLLTGALTALCVVLLIVTVAYKMPVLLVAILWMVGFAGAHVKTMWRHSHSSCVTGKMYTKRRIGAVKAIDRKPKYIQMLVCEIDCGKSRKFCARIAIRTAIDPLIEVGDKVVFTAVFHPPSSPDSANGFDFARYAFFQGIAATGFTISEVKLYEKVEKIKLQDWVERIRARSYKRFLSGLSEDCAEILAALLIGKRSGLREEVLTNMRNSGLAHLLAISGLHLSFVAGIAFLSFRYLAAFSERISLCYDAKKICAVAAIVVSFFYLLVAGVPISARRAFIMVFIAFCGIIINRRHDALASVAAAAFVVLLFAPEAVFSPSFQMSFSAVMALISVGNLLTNVPSATKYIAGTALSSLIASIATAPYVIYHFHYFSFAGILANIIAVPVTTFVVMPLGLIYQIATPLRIPVSYLLEYAVEVVLSVAKYAAHIDWAVRSYGAIPGGAVLTISCGMLVVCCFRGTLVICGALVVALGTVWAFIYQTPDIILDQGVVVVKNRDSRLYFLTLNCSGRGRKYTRWARDNKQQYILRHVYAGEESKLRCASDGCIFSDIVLISQHKDFLIKRCKSAELVIYSGTEAYPAECEDIKHVTSLDILSHGVHYVWIHGDSVRIEKSITQRLWHENFRRTRKRICEKKHIASVR